MQSQRKRGTELNNLRNRLTRLESDMPTHYTHSGRLSYEGFLSLIELITGGTEVGRGYHHDGFGVTRAKFDAIQFDSPDHCYQWTKELCDKHRDSWVLSPEYKPEPQCRMSLQKAQAVYHENLKRFAAGMPIIPIE